MDKISIHEIKDHLKDTLYIIGDVDGEEIRFPVRSIVTMDSETWEAQERFIPGQHCKLNKLTKENDGFWTAELEAYEGSELRIPRVASVQAITDGINECNWYDLIPKFH